MGLSTLNPAPPTEAELCAGTVASRSRGLLSRKTWDAHAPYWKSPMPQGHRRIKPKVVIVVTYHTKYGRAAALASKGVCRRCSRLHQTGSTRNSRSVLASAAAVVSTKHVNPLTSRASGVHPFPCKTALTSFRLMLHSMLYESGLSHLIAAGRFFFFLWGHAATQQRSLHAGARPVSSRHHRHGHRRPCFHRR